jgi:hypothetical protein
MTRVLRLPQTYQAKARRYRHRRSYILDRGQLAQFLVFKNRPPMMHRASWEGPHKTSQMAFAWFIGDRAHTWPATIYRISRGA